MVEYMELMKKVITIVISILLIAVASTTAMAETYFSDGEFEFVKTDKGNGLITLCELTDARVTVPNFILEYPIAGIGDYAFMNMPTLRSISMPLSIVTIGEYAFAENTQLLIVRIPRYCDQIASTAFANSPNVIIAADEDSYAAQYAEDMGIDFIVSDDYIIGDVNGDGNLTIRDVTCIQLKLVDKMEFDNKQMALADVNGDGKVSIRDATYIQMYKVGMISSFDSLT